MTTTSLSLQQAQLIKHTTECMACGGSSLAPILHLGDHYLTDFLDAPASGWPKAPLELNVCESCQHMQLGHQVDRKRLFGDRYFYRSATNETMKTHLSQLAAACKERLSLGTGDPVVDIGSNDGTFLSHFSEQETVGFEPTGMTATGVKTEVSELFTSSAYPIGKPSKLIASIAMFYDVLTPKVFSTDIASILDPNGLWVCEMNYLGDMLRNTAFDFIGHEHIGYYWLSTLNKVIRPAGLEVIDVSLHPINGGTMRTWIAHKGAYPTEAAVDRFLGAEAPLRDPKVYQEFVKKVNITTKTLNQWAKDIKADGKTLYIKGVSTRGMTTLQASSLDSTLITSGMDISPAKHGKYVAGLDIPIKSLEAARLDKPDYLLALPWSYRAEFLEQEKALLASGSRFIFPMPELEVVSG
jgi:NDP-4-keto-2,6-dideoxyhexose 3-C-methyltransferase